MRLYYYILVLISCIVCTTNLYAEDIIEDEEDSNKNISELFKIFINSQDNLVSKPMICFGFGLSNNTLPIKLNIDNLPITNDFSFEYGFCRIDSTLKLFDLLNYSSEFVYVESNTNKFGLVKKSDNAIYDNEFSFGGGLRSGMGYRLTPDKNKQLEIFLLHSSSFLWTYFDYSNYKPAIFFEVYDDNYKFGWKGSAALELRFSKNFFFDVEYEHNNIYSGFEFAKWTGSWLVDNVFQRWIDFFDPIFLEKLGYSYPIFKFIYKNSISIILSEIRQSKQYFPFDSDYSLLQRRLNFRFRFIF